MYIIAAGNKCMQSKNYEVVLLKNLWSLNVWYRLAMYENSKYEGWLDPVFVSLAI